MNALFSVANSIGVTFGLPNMDTKYPTYIERIFKERGFNGESLELFPMDFRSGISFTYEGGFDLSGCADKIQMQFNKALMSSPVMQSRDYFDYKVLSLHIRGKESSERVVNLLAKDAFNSLKDVASFSDLFEAKPIHTGLECSINKLEIICHIFRNATMLSILHRERNECLQSKLSFRSIEQELLALEDDVSPLFAEGGHLSESLLLKLFTGTHPELQLGDDSSFKFFKEEDFVIVESEEQDL